MVFFTYDSSLLGVILLRCHCFYRTGEGVCNRFATRPITRSAAPLRHGRREPRAAVMVSRQWCGLDGNGDDTTRLEGGRRILCCRTRMGLMIMPESAGPLHAGLTMFLRVLRMLASSCFMPSTGHLTNFLPHASCVYNAHDSNGTSAACVEAMSMR